MAVAGPWLMLTQLLVLLGLTRQHDNELVVSGGVFVQKKLGHVGLVGCWVSACQALKFSTEVARFQVLMKFPTSVNAFMYLLLAVTLR